MIMKEGLLKCQIKRVSLQEEKLRKKNWDLKQQVKDPHK